MNLSSTLFESLSTGVNVNLPRSAGETGQGATVVRVALNHTVQLSSLVRLSEGLPELDRLKGDGGGLSRQNVQVMIDAQRARTPRQDGYRSRRVGGAMDPMI